MEKLYKDMTDSEILDGVEAELKCYQEAFRLSKANAKDIELLKQEIRLLRQENAELKDKLK